jgi:hypothetical protein
MNITQNLCSNALRKVALLITKASDLGINISGEGEAAENQNNGNVYLWLEDYPFTLYIDLGSDKVYANWSSSLNDCEESIDTSFVTSGLMSLENLTQWANNLSNAEEQL